MEPATIKTFARLGIRAQVSRYQLRFPEEGIPPIEIVRVDPEKDLWAVKWLGNRLNAKGEWEFEPLPSSRGIDFLRRTRWSKGEAIRRASELPVDASRVH